MAKRKKIGRPAPLSLVLIVITLVIIVIAASLWYGGRTADVVDEEIRGPTVEDLEMMIEKLESERTGTTRIINFLIADDITENFGFRLRNNNQFVQGDEILFYHEVIVASDKVDSVFRISFSEDFTLTEPDGAVVESVLKTGKGSLEKEVEGPGLYYIPVRNVLDTSDFEQKGNYKLELKVVNELTKEEANDEIWFRLK